MHTDWYENLPSVRSGRALARRLAAFAYAAAALAALAAPALLYAARRLIASPETGTAARVGFAFASVAVPLAGAAAFALIGRSEARLGRPPSRRTPAGAPGR